jgi:ribonuclease P protein component
LFKTGRFTRSERIKRSQDIQHLFKQGKRVSTSGAKLFFLKNNSPADRVVFALPRGYGNAVTRNRSKRLSREAYRYSRAKLLPGYDLLILIYPGNDTYSRRIAQLQSLFVKAGLIT